MKGRFVLLVAGALVGCATAPPQPQQPLSSHERQARAWAAEQRLMLDRANAAAALGQDFAVAYRSEMQVMCLAWRPKITDTDVLLDVDHRCGMLEEQLKAVNSQNLNIQADR